MKVMGSDLRSSRFAIEERAAGTYRTEVGTAPEATWKSNPSCPSHSLSLYWDTSVHIR